MPKSKLPYPLEFRREAVELVRFSGRPLREIAEGLGVTEQSLRNWVRQAEVDAGRAAGLTGDEKVELGELCRKVRTLEMERDVLNKAPPPRTRSSSARPQPSVEAATSATGATHP